MVHKGEISAAKIILAVGRILGRVVGQRLAQPDAHLLVGDAQGVHVAAAVIVFDGEIAALVEYRNGVFNPLRGLIETRLVGLNVIHLGEIQVIMLHHFEQPGGCGRAEPVQSQLAACQC